MGAAGRVACGRLRPAAGAGPAVRGTAGTSRSGPAALGGEAAVRPFRFGVLTKGAPTRKAWHERLGRVQDAGFSSLLVPVHTTPQFSPVAALADAAARTSLRIGTLV